VIQSKLSYKSQCPCLLDHIFINALRAGMPTIINYVVQNAFTTHKLFSCGILFFC